MRVTISLFLLVSAYTVCGSIVYVDGNSPSNSTVCGSRTNPCSSISAGLNHTKAGDELLIQSGSYTVIYTLNIAIPIRIIGNGSVEIHGRLSPFSLAAPVHLNGLTFSNFVHSTLLVQSSGITIDHCRFNNNSAESGAAILVQGPISLLSITNCDFNNNKAVYSGGAIILSGCNKTNIENCNFLQNSATAGGGAIQSDDQNHHTSIKNCTFESNSSEGLGGVIGFINSVGQPGPQINIKNSLFSKSIVTGRYSAGGSLYLYGMENVLIDSCSFSENSVTNFGAVSTAGGAVYITETPEIIISNSYFIDNQIVFSSSISPVGGAGLSIFNSYRMHRGNLTLDSCYFHNNWALPIPIRNIGMEMSISGMEHVSLLRTTIADASISVPFDNIMGLLCSINSRIIVVDGLQLLDNDISLEAEEYSNALEGLIYLAAENRIEVKNSIFSGNTVTIAPTFSQFSALGYLLNLGAMMPESVIVSNCTVSQNSLISVSYTGPVLLLGGAIGISSLGNQLSSSFEIVDSIFKDNSIITLYSTGSTFIISGSALNIAIYPVGESSIRVWDCEFQNNLISSESDYFPANDANQSYGGAAAIASNSTLVDFQNCNFTNNRISYLGTTSIVNAGGLYITGNNVTMKNCKFIGQSILTENVDCADGVSAEGGALVVDSFVFFLEDSLFSDNSISVQCRMSGISSVFNGALLHLCSFTFSQEHCGNSHISQVEFLNNTVRGDTASGGVMLIRNEASILQNCYFQGNGCYSTDSTRDGKENNRGGALQFNDGSTLLENCIFEDNFAIFGGAIAVEKMIRSEYEAYNNLTFINNEAVIGGAIFVEFSVFGGGMLLDKNSFGTFENNTALLYGDGAASQAYEMDGRNFSIVYPGQRFDIFLEVEDAFGTPVALETNLIQVNTLSNSNFQWYGMPEDAVIQTNAQPPLYTIKDAFFTCAPSNDLQYINYNLTNGIALYSMSYEQSYSIVQCPPDFTFITPLNACAKCLIDEYSFGDICQACPTGTSCSSIATNLPLDGIYNITLGPDIWPVPYESPTSMITCPFLGSCIPITCITTIPGEGKSLYWATHCVDISDMLGSTNPVPFCTEGYTDRLCSRCVCTAEICFYESGGKCVQCNASVVIAFYVSMIAFVIITAVLFTLPLGGLVLVIGEIGVSVVLAFAGFMSWSAFIVSAWMLLFTAAMGDKIRSASLKSLLTFLQFAQLLCNPIFWPDWFDIDIEDGDNLLLLPGVSCISPFFAQNPTWKFLFSMLLPALLMIFVVIVSVVGFYIRSFLLSHFKQFFPQSSPTGPRDSIQAEGEEIALLSERENSMTVIDMPNDVLKSPLSSETLRAILFIAYSSYLVLTAAIFTIFEPCENGYQISTPWIPCSSNSHLFVTLNIVAVIFCCLYVIGIPLLFAVLLLRYKDDIHAGTPIGKAVEFLHEEYRKEMYYYELVWMLRKLLIAIGVMIIPLSSGLQYPFCVSVLCLFNFAQSTCKPFTHRIDNMTENIGSLSIIILYSISVLSEDSFSYISDIFTIFFAFIVLLLLGVTFLPLWRKIYKHFWKPKAI